MSRLPERIYSWLLLAYPAGFRRHFGVEMMQIFRARLRAATEARTIGYAVVFWKGILMDWIASAAREWMSSVTVGGAALIVTALCFGFFAAYVDFQNDEVQAPVLVVLAGSFFLGVVQPHSAWRWPLIIALWLPIARWIGPQFGIDPKLPAMPNNFATLLALIPAYIGAYSGVSVRLFGRFLMH